MTFYEAGDDPYLYKGTAVLKNRAGIREAPDLERYEAAATLARSREPLPDGRLGVAHYRAVHRHLFQDVYSWAGRLRTVRLAKGTSVFCYPENIAAQLARTFADLRDKHWLRNLAAEDFADGAAHLLAELNAVHAFREGNGRAQNSFFEMIAEQAGHKADFSRLVPVRFLEAMIESFNGDEEALAAQVLALIDR